MNQKRTFGTILTILGIVGIIIGALAFLGIGGIGHSKMSPSLPWWWVSSSFLPASTQ